MLKKFLIKYGLGFTIALAVLIGGNYSFIIYPETELWGKIVLNVIAGASVTGLIVHARMWYKAVKKEQEREKGRLTGGKP